MELAQSLKLQKEVMACLGHKGTCVLKNVIVLLFDFVSRVAGDRVFEMDGLHLVVDHCF